MTEKDNGWQNHCKHGFMYFYAAGERKRKKLNNHKEDFVCELCLTDPFIKKAPDDQPDAISKGDL